MPQRAGVFKLFVEPQNEKLQHSKREDSGDNIASELLE